VKHKDWIKKNPCKCAKRIVDRPNWNGAQFVLCFCHQAGSFRAVKMWLELSDFRLQQIVVTVHFAVADVTTHFWNKTESLIHLFNKLLKLLHPCSMFCRTGIIKAPHTPGTDVSATPTRKHCRSITDIKSHTTLSTRSYPDKNITVSEIGEEHTHAVFMG